jgi:hypothetical protein
LEFFFNANREPMTHEREPPSSPGCGKSTISYLR